jgi:hypothetical protein
MTRRVDPEHAIVARLQTALDNSGEWLSLADAARRFDIPLATLAQAVREGRVPALRVQARRWLVRPAALSAALKNGGLNRARGRPKTSV